MADQSMYTMTPGSAVADQLQEILLRKRQEAQQVFQNQMAQQQQAMSQRAQDLNQRNVESEIQTREDEAKSRAADRASNAEDRKAQEIQRRAGLYSPHQALAPNDVGYFQKNAPSLVDPAGPAPGTIDNAAGVEGPNPAPLPDRFHGLPVQLENDRKVKLQEDAMKSLTSPEFEKLPAIQKEMIYRQATGGGSLPEHIVSPKEGGRTYLLDEASQKMFDAATRQPFNGVLQPNDKIERIPRPPHDPQDHGTLVERPVVDPSTGLPDPSKVYIMKNGQLTISNVPNGLRIGDRPRVGDNKPAVASSQTKLQWMNARTKMIQNPKDQNIRDLATTAAKMFIKESTKDDMVASALREAFDAGPKVWSLSGKALAAKAKGATPKQLSDIESIWDELRSNQAPPQ